jgi:hypothetical protein
MDAKDRQEWAIRAATLRKFAAENPVRKASDLKEIAEKSAVPFGFYRISLTRDEFVSPARWHGSISYLGVLGTESLDRKGTVQVPVEGLLLVEAWPKDVYADARDMLVDLMSPLIRHNDTQVIQFDGAIALHLIVVNPYGD